MSQLFFRKLEEYANLSEYFFFWGGGCISDIMERNGNDAALICLIHLCFKDNGILKLTRIPKNRNFPEVLIFFTALSHYYLIAGKIIILIFC